MNAPVLTDVLISKSQNATDPNQTKINLRKEEKIHAKKPCT